jgi:arsenate reductase-like glutaredoxin family protein
MADEAEKVEATEEGVDSTENASPTVDELMEQIAEIRKVQSGSDKKVQELSQALTQKDKELGELKKQAMTESERLKYEKEEAERRASELESRQKELETERLITAGLAAKKLDVSVSELMQKPTDAESLARWLERFEGVIQPEVERRVNEKLVSAKPKSGGTQEQAPTIETREDAMKASPEEFGKWLETQIT